MSARPPLLMCTVVLLIAGDALVLADTDRASVVFLDELQETGRLTPKIQSPPEPSDGYPSVSSPDLMAVSGELGPRWGSEGEREGAGPSDRFRRDRFRRGQSRGPIGRLPPLQNEEGDPFADEPWSGNREGGSDEAGGQMEQGGGREDAATLDQTTSNLALISFPKVFDELTLLNRSKATARASQQGSCCPPYRDPCFGFERTSEFCWVASNVAHKTLYFDDDPLERYGYTCSPLLQPAISVAEFYKDLLAAPIRGIFDGPSKCHFVAGRHRVGSCACDLKERIIPRTCR